MSIFTSFLTVAVVTLFSTAVVVSLYSLGLRLLVTAGRAPVVEPLEFTGAITVLTPHQAAKAAKRARKAEAANPLTPVQKRIALIAAYICFALTACAVLFGVYLIVPALHG